MSKLEGKRVLLVLPDVKPADVAAVLQRAGADFGPDASDGESREVRIPVRAEKLDVKKYLVQSGNVRVYKEIITDVERFEVLLLREEFVIERRPLDDQSSVEVIRIPLYHEEVAVSKRTIVTNEVSIRRQQHEEVRHIEQPLRSEKIHLAHEGDVTLHDVQSH